MKRRRTFGEGKLLALYEELNMTALVYRATARTAHCRWLRDRAGGMHEAARRLHELLYGYGEGPNITNFHFRNLALGWFTREEATR